VRLRSVCSPPAELATAEQAPPLATVGLDRDGTLALAAGDRRARRGPLSPPAAVTGPCSTGRAAVMRLPAPTWKSPTAHLTAERLTVFQPPGRAEAALGQARVLGLTRGTELLQAVGDRAGRPAEALAGIVDLPR
jgi:hypothetical protein